MVHRPADSRLLTNLLSHEKDYAKQLRSLLDYSNSSVASFSAYASASSPPASHVILAVASSLAGADDAMRRYAASIDDWMELLRGLKALEDDVGNIMRDREILVTRLIKASKSQKPNRDSLILSHQRFPSNSSLSITPDSASPSTYGNNVNTSSKLAAAQAELQACESHLAAKENELAYKRNAVVRDGLGIRCRAMAECGWVWGEMGREALKTLETLSDHNAPSESLAPQHTSAQSITSKTDSKPLPEPGSDISSIGPSQSASQVNLTLPPPVPSPIGNPNGFLAFASVSDSHQQLNIPPAHSISELEMPTMSPSNSPHPQRHTLPRRITEEDLPLRGGDATKITRRPGETDEELQRRSWVNQLEIANTNSMSGHGDVEEPGEASTSEDEDEELQKGELAVVQNPRFNTASASATNLTPTTPPAVKAKAYQPPSQKHESTRSFTIRNQHDGGTPTKSFFGSIRGLFGGKHATKDKDKTDSPSKDRRREVDNEQPDDEDDSDREEQTQRGGKNLFSRAARRVSHSSPSGSPNIKSGKWETRTERNIRDLQNRQSEDAGPKRSNPVRQPLMEPVVLPDADAATGFGRALKGRPRVVSDASGVASSSTAKPYPGVGESVKSEGKRLKKPRINRSSSVPPVGSSEGVKPQESTPPVDSKDGARVKSVQKAEEWVGGQRAHEAAVNVKSKDADVSAAKDYASDTEMPGNGGVARKKSVTRKKSAAASGGVTIISAGAGPSSTVSRNTSIRSNTSAPAMMTKHRAGMATAPDIARTTGLGTGMPTTTVGRRSSMTASAKGKKDQQTAITAVGGSSHRRANSVDLGSPAPKSAPAKAKTQVIRIPDPNLNLMSIVEDTTRTNREGGDPASSKSATALEDQIIKAPPRVAREDLLTPSGRVGGPPTGAKNMPLMEIPKAPGPVVDILRAAGTSGSDIDTSHHERRQSIGGNVSGGSISVPDLSNSSGLMRQNTGSSSNRPAKSPFRSALRNSSRSPSPILRHNTAADKARANSPLPAVHSALRPPRSTEVAGIPHSQLPAVVSTLPWEQDRKKSQEADDDSASVSSYETGHEMFSTDEETEREDEPTKLARQVNGNVGFGGSDISTSTNSTTIVQPQATAGTYGLNQDVGISRTSSESRSADATPTPAHPVTRRKSVRVSLQPTFSPTPPAIDEDDEDEQQKHAPWVWRNDTTPVPAQRRPSLTHQHEHVKQNGTAEKDIWDDSSDEDAEYKKARKLLSRMAKKEKAR